MILRSFIPILLLFIGLSSVAQGPASEELIEEGIALHDQGEFQKAIDKYKEVLAVDSTNVLALYEMSYSEFSFGHYEETVLLSQKVISLSPDAGILKHVYTSYANALDQLGRVDAALMVYDEAIEDFPEYYQLYFNKGITLSGQEKFDKALACFQTAVELEPDHASSHNAIGRLLMVDDDNIPALMALCRSMVIEPQGPRAAANLPLIQQIMTANVERTGKKSVTITLDERTIDEMADTSKKENDFSSVEMLLSFSAAMDIDKKNKKKTERELFRSKMESVCDIMQEIKEEHSGFYWEYYAPYFIEMREHDLIGTLSYLVFASTEEKDVIKWLEEHRDELDTFYGWSNSYSWKD